MLVESEFSLQTRKGPVETTRPVAQKLGSFLCDKAFTLMPYSRHHSLKRLNATVVAVVSSVQEDSSKISLEVIFTASNPLIGVDLVLRMQQTLNVLCDLGDCNECQ